jgi:hypothetical protein
MLNASNPQPVLSEQELKAKFATRNLFSFTGYLARKGAPKSYTEKKKPTYRLNILGFFSGSLLRILAAFMAVSGFLAAIFFGSALAGAFFAVVLLVALEFLQLRNATELFETWFAESRVVMSCVVYGLIFSATTATLAFMGVDDTIKFVSEKVSPFEFDEHAVSPTLLTDITKAEADAQEFYKARSWKGKLDPKDGKQYNKLKAHATELRTQYRNEVATARTAAKSSYDKDTANKEQNNADNRFYLTLFIAFSELLFWLAFYHKERYEFLALNEAKLTGKITQEKAPASNVTTYPIPKRPSFPVNGNQPQNRAPIGYKVNPDGNVPVAAPVQPVSQLYHNVSQPKSETGTLGADAIITANRTKLYADMNNLQKGNGVRATVARRIHATIDTVGRAMENKEFEPSEKLVTDFFFYMQDTVFPTLREYKAAYAHDNWFLETLELFVPETAFAKGEGA